MVLHSRSDKKEAAGTKEAAPKEEYANEADVNLSEQFFPIMLLIRRPEKFDLQDLNFVAFNYWLTIPM